MRGLLLFFLGLSSLGAQTLSLDLGADRHAVGDRFEVTVRLSGESSGWRLETPVLPPALSLQSGVLVRPSFWNDAQGLAVGGLAATFTVRVQQPGVVLLGPFTWVQGERRLNSPTRDLYLLGPDEQGRRYPMSVYWDLGPGPYYQGQAIPLVLRTGNLEQLVPTQEVSLASPGNAILERALGLGDVVIRNEGPDRLFDLPWDSWLLIPTAPGQLVLRPSAFTVTGLRRQTPELRLTVESLPADIRTTRAIGDFAYTVQQRGPVPAAGGELTLVQELRGTGNFPYLTFPSPDWGDFRVLERSEEESYRPGRRGFEGWRRVLWRLAAPDIPGAYTLTLPGFVHTLAGTDRVIRSADRALTLTFSAAAEESSAPDTRIPLPEARRLSLPTQALEVYGAGRQAYETGDFLEAERLWAQGVRDLGAGDPAATERLRGLHWLRALALWEAGHRPQALALGRAYARQLDQSSEIDSRLALWESALGLRDQVPLRLSQAETPLWFFSLASLALAALFAVVKLTAQRGSWAAALGLGFAALALLAAVGVMREARLSHHGVLVASEAGDAEVMKVPEVSAESWIRVPSGTAVKVLGRSNAYRLIRTGYGLEGWVKAGDLAPDPFISLDK